MVNGELNCGYEVWEYIKRGARDYALSDARKYETILLFDRDMKFKNWLKSLVFICISVFPLCHM